MLPVKSLQEPPDEMLVRDRNPHVASLKLEMLENAFSDVQPILCIAQLKSEESFDKNLKEAYLYHTIGGNHSRQALQELLKERRYLEQNRQYTHRFMLPRNDNLGLGMFSNFLNYICLLTWYSTIVGGAE